MPFTYVGEISAYSRSEPGRSADTDVTVSPRKLFIADYVVKKSVVWVLLKNNNLLFGKSYSAGGAEYQLRAPSVGSTNTGNTAATVPNSNEWDRILQKNSSYIKNSDGNNTSWGQDYAFDENNVVIRGGATANSSSYCSRVVGSIYLGYRPVLQISPEEDLRAITVDLNGGTLGEEDTLHIVAKKDSAFAAPANEGITRPGEAEGEYFKWEGSDGNLYAPGDSVSAGVTSLTALYEAPIVPPTITTTTLADGTVNEAYSRSLTATGDEPIAWSIVSGSLPSGLSLSGSTISGTPTAAGTFSFTVKAQNSAGSDTKALSIEINPAQPDEEDDFVPRTLTDSPTGTTVSGNISESALLTVGSMTLGSDNAGNTIRLWMNNKDYQMLLGVDISLSSSFTGPLTLSLKVGAQYNGQTVTILHAKKDGSLETYTAKVNNGNVTFNVAELSPFAVFIRDGLDDVPKTGSTDAAWVWWTLAVLGAGAIALVLARRKAVR